MIEAIEATAEVEEGAEETAIVISVEVEVIEMTAEAVTEGTMEIEEADLVEIGNFQTIPVRYLYSRGYNSGSCGRRRAL